MVATRLFSNGQMGIKPSQVTHQATVLARVHPFRRTGFSSHCTKAASGPPAPHPPWERGGVLVHSVWLLPGVLPSPTLPHPFLLG